MQKEDILKRNIVFSLIPVPVYTQIICVIKNETANKHLMSGLSINVILV